MCGSRNDTEVASLRRGSYLWQQVQVGQTIAIPCKYRRRMGKIKYARRKCILVNGTASWENSTEIDLEDCDYKARKHNELFVITRNMVNTLYHECV